MPDEKSMLEALVAAETPDEPPPFKTTPRGSLVRRRGLLVGVVAAGVAASVAGAVLLGNQNSPSSAPLAGQDPTPRAGATSASAHPSSSVVGVPHSCVEAYSLAALASRSFAFDGEVTEISPGNQVTFRVFEWFAGGEGDRVTIQMYAAPDSSAGVPSEFGPEYAEGTRMLVSGEPRWGGAPLNDAIAWSCGFSRVYSLDAATEWDEATSAS